MRLVPAAGTAPAASEMSCSSHDRANSRQQYLLGTRFDIAQRIS